jgi:hypothetical protein
MVGFVWKIYLEVRTGYFESTVFEIAAAAY